MKKVLLVAAVAAFAMTSCKKDYTCNCTVATTTYQMGQASTANTTTSGSTGKMKKDDAKKKCEDGTQTQMVGDTDNGIKTVVTCAIK